MALRWAMVTSQAAHVAARPQVRVGLQGGEERLGPGVVGVDGPEQGPAHPQHHGPVLGHDLLEGDHGDTLAQPGRPVSRNVMLSRPGGRPRPSGAVPAITLGTPW